MNYSFFSFFVCFVIKERFSSARKSLSTVAKYDQGVQLYQGLQFLVKGCYHDEEMFTDFEKKELPKPVSLGKLIGPSFILLGLGLGSGEIILWPFLVSQFGLGIIWAAVFGISMQFFLNMEIARYSLATGESVFVGLTRKFGILSPYWFIFSTLIPWIWPGIVASSGLILANLFGLTYTAVLPITLLCVIGLILSLGPVLYKTQENLQKIVIWIGVPVVFAITFFLAKPADWQELGLGLLGKGVNFWFLPKDLSMAAFLGAMAYAGAGGNLNLAQSLYVKAKGYGMGKYSGQITSLFTGKKEDIRLTGFVFEMNKKNLSRFNIWWRRMNLEHAVVFWLTGGITILILAVLAFSTVFNSNDNQAGIGFILNESRVISTKSTQWLGGVFLLIVGTMLFFTQFSVLGSTSRIMTENLAILTWKKLGGKYISLYFYMFLWLQIAAGIVIFILGFNEPLKLVVLGAVLNAFSMFVYSGLIFWLNNTLLPKPIRPSLIRQGVIICSFLFYGFFSMIVIYENVVKALI